MLRQAVREFEAGHLAEAERACRAILRDRPAATDALNLLAAVLGRRGEHASATSLLQGILERAPADPAALWTLRDVCKATGQFGVAVAAFLRATEVRPKDPDVWWGLGLCLTHDGKRELAVHSLRRAVALRPGTANHHVALGIVLVELERFEEAVTVHRQALARHPGVAELHAGLGAALMKLGRCDEAIAAYGQAATLAPDRAADWLADANHAMALHLRARARHHAAAAALDQALVLRPRWPDAHNCLGVVLKQMGRSDDAILSFRRAIALDPGHTVAHVNLGATLHDSGALEEAVAVLRTGVALAPTANGCGNLANVLRDIGETDDARSFYQRAVACDPADPVACYNQALSLLLEGDLAAGFAGYEWRREVLDGWSRPRTFAQPEWQGEALAGRTILLHAEQGLGDTIQFVRFAPRVAALGGRVILRVQDPLVRLCAAAFPGMRVLGQSEPVPPFDCHVPLMSLAWRLGTTLATIPDDVPYLAVDAAKIARWRERLAPAAGLKVGLVCAGNPTTRHDRLRSIPLRMLLGHLPDEGVSLFSLQKDVRPDDATTLAAAGARVTDLAPALVDFSDTAAAISALDLVITVDSAVAHLAGALARPAWVLLHHALDWRWLRHRADSPWYPTLRLFRQSRGREWSDVLARLGASVRDLAAASSSEDRRVGP